MCLIMRFGTLLFTCLAEIANITHKRDFTETIFHNKFRVILLMRIAFLKSNMLQ